MTVHEENLNGFVISIHFDDNAENPRMMSDCYVGTVAIPEGFRYRIGDKDGWGNLFRALECSKYAKDSWFNENSRYYIDSSTKEGMETLLDKCKDVIALPVYIYSHGGITINTTGFSCPWDSGQIGWIFTTKEKVTKEYDVKILTSLVRRMVEERLKSEIEELDNWLTGEVYGYVIKNPEGEEVDSCWGFYGKMEYCLEAAKEQLPYYVEAWKNKIPGMLP